VLSRGEFCAQTDAILAGHHSSGEAG
jgi:hypothetical protein